MSIISVMSIIRVTIVFPIQFKTCSTSGNLIADPYILANKSRQVLDCGEMPTTVSLLNRHRNKLSSNVLISLPYHVTYRLFHFSNFIRTFFSFFLPFSSLSFLFFSFLFFSFLFFLSFSLFLFYNC